jgi:hypothetical protein
MYEKDAMLLRSLVGTATGPDGTEFEMSLINGHTPAVKDMKTGRTWSVGWQDLIEQGIAAGVSQEPHHANP